MSYREACALLGLPLVLDEGVTYAEAAALGDEADRRLDALGVPPGTRKARLADLMNRDSAQRDPNEA